MANKPTYEDLKKRVKKLEREVAKRKNLAESLEKNAEKFLHILDGIEEGYYEIDLAGTFTFANETLCNFYGLSFDALMGRNYREFASQEAMERIYRIFNEVYRTGIPAQIVDFEFIRADKFERIIEGSVSLLRNASGEPIGFYGMTRDRTELKKAEMALRESEEKYRLVVDNAHEGIYITQEGMVKFSNPRIEELTGYSIEELAGMPFVDLVHPEDKKPIIEKQQKRLEGEKQPSPYSFRIRNRANETLWVELNTIPIDWEGRPADLNFLRDITPQKRMEAQFLQAQKMEAVGTLAGGIAHDFNNLLMGIQGNASLILLDIESHHPHYAKLRSIEQIVKGGAELTKQLLGVARGGKYELKATNLNKLVEMSADLFGRTRKEISVHKLLQQDVWPVEVDRSQIEQVLLNLYVNAWHAMPDGGELYLETRNVTLDEYYVRPYGVAPGKYVKISVTDTGVGMDEATKRRVFDPFFTTKEMGRGTGLGLASAYGIVKNHSGIINVYSEKGEGTTFNIYLPISKKDILEETDSRQELLKGTESILFVDDEEVIIEIGQQLLEKLGYRVISANSGPEAVEVFRREGDRIDLVVLDMIMPGMSGGETYDRLKEINPQVKVLLASGYSLNGQAKAILDRGCKGFLQKPFNMTDLSKKVRKILEE